MVGYITESNGGNYTPTPSGQHVMVCTRIVDLGTQPGSAMYPAPKHKVRIFWELPEERVTYTDGDGNEKEGPVLHSEQYTASFNEKANLRKHLESWRGKPFDERDFSGPPDGFHMSKLIGVPALGQIVHETRDGKTYANLSSIMSLRPDDMKKFRGQIEGEKIYFSFEKFEQQEFDKLSERLRNTIKNSPEYQNLFGDTPDTGYSQDSEDPSGGLRDSVDMDEIPF